MTRRAAAVSFGQSAQTIAGRHGRPTEFVGFHGKQSRVCGCHLAAFFVMIWGVKKLLSAAGNRAFYDLDQPGQFLLSDSINAHRYSSFHEIGQELAWHCP
jgi:hypothetical protein